jgi:large subunit ribosomal protein L13
MQKVTRSLTKEAAQEARSWYIVDATGETLGRLSTRIARALRGKNNPAFTPHVDCGDFVVVINAEKVKLTGRKLEQKTYYRHSGWVGGIREETASQLLKRAPEELIRRAVHGMLPGNRLGRQLETKLKIYAGAEHPHVAQKPAPLEA